MTLPELILPSRANQRWKYSGIDSLEQCKNRKHFKRYLYPVDYVYNSRGFRDEEWPNDVCDLRNAIWCLGDSFTVGVGQPLIHIWPQVLAMASGHRCINISMDGASNDWIFRRTQDIFAAIRPKHMIIMWSYTHRRESPDVRLDDEQRRMPHSLTKSLNNPPRDYAHWAHHVNKVHAMNEDIVQCTIPDFQYDYNIGKKWHDIKGKDWPACPRTLADLQTLPTRIIDKLKSFDDCYSDMVHCLQPPKILHDVIHITERLDWARDYHHFDILTSRWVVDQIMQHLRI